MRRMSLCIFETVYIFIVHSFLVWIMICGENTCMAKMMGYLLFPRKSIEKN